MSLSPQAQVAFGKANAAYIALMDKKYPQISITSGRRSVYTQAGLRERYTKYKMFGGKKWDPADLPAESTHQYGVAVDVVNKDDEAKIGKALRDNGWKDPYANEPWHFDATATGDYADAQKIIQALAEDYSEWGKTLEQVLKIEHAIPKRQQAVALLTNKASFAAQKARKARQDVMLLQQRIRQTEGQIEGAKKAVATAAKEVDDLFKSYDGYTYTMCPNGHPFETCTHEDLKAAYVTEKARREALWREAKAKLAALSPELAGLQSRLISLNTRLVADTGKAQQLADEAKRLADSLKTLKDLLNADKALATIGRQRMRIILDALAVEVADGP
jgi:chromosome segregation ATPase